jgi:hypothetical protein
MKEFHDICICNDFPLLIQFIRSFAVLCTVARAPRSCLAGAGVPFIHLSHLYHKCLEIDVDKLNNLLYREYLHNAFVGFRVLELKVGK